MTTPIIIDQFGYTESDATLVTSIIYSFCYAFGLACYLLLQVLAKHFDERKLLITVALVPMCIGRLFFLPFPGTEEPDYNDNLTLVCESEEKSFNSHNEEVISRSLTYLRNVDCLVVEEEAPLCQHCWCPDQPGLYFWQLAIGTVLVASGVRSVQPIKVYSLMIICLFISFARILVQTLYTKGLGPRPMVRKQIILNDLTVQTF